MLSWKMLQDICITYLAVHYSLFYYFLRLTFSQYLFWIKKAFHIIFIHNCIFCTMANIYFLFAKILPPFREKEIQFYFNYIFNQYSWCVLFVWRIINLLYKILQHIYIYIYVIWWAFALKIHIYIIFYAILNKLLS